MPNSSNLQFCIYFSSPETSPTSVVSRREDAMRRQVLHAVLLDFIAILLIFCSFPNLALLLSYVSLPSLDVTPSQNRRDRPNKPPLGSCSPVHTSTNSSCSHLAYVFFPSPHGAVTASEIKIGF